jgi:transcriptional regulator with XRE-family HTH domain
MSEKSELIGKLSRDQQLREAYIRSKVSTNVASQIRALRRRGKLTQGDLAQMANMKQSRISAVEYPGNQLAVETLVRLAAALKVGLTVRFGSFSEMVNWENEFSQDDFSVVTLDHDMEFQRDKEEGVSNTETINQRPQNLRPQFVEAKSYSEPAVPFPSCGSESPCWVDTESEAIYAASR